MRAYSIPEVAKIASLSRQAEPVKKTPKPLRVEIVPARRRGVTGYANVGRGTPLGNPFSPEAGDGNISLCVVKYELAFYKGRVRRDAALALLDRDWPGGVVRLGCPCNGVEKGQPCHAEVIKEYLEAEIARRAEK